MNVNFFPGIPATLNYIPLQGGTPSSPRLIPYPDWPSNELGNCERGLSTVYRIKVDECDRLWVLDTGTFGIENTTTNPCPYALNVFDLYTNTRIRRYELRREDTNAETFIANIAIDIGGSCQDAFAYMSDELGYGLIAYSWAENRSWRFEHGFFLPDPLKGDFNIGGLNFQWFEEGIFGMSLSPLQRNGYRILFFSPLASNREFAVSTQTLRNSSKVEDSYKEFYALNERGPLSHTTSRVMDEYGVQFFNLIDQNAVGCWSMANPYQPSFHAVVDRDDETLSFPADVKVDRNRNLWVISDRMPNFLLSNLDPNDINFRIFFAPIEVLTQGTVCEAKLNPLNLYSGGVQPLDRGVLIGNALGPVSDRNSYYFGPYRGGNGLQTPAVSQGGTVKTYPGLQTFSSGVQPILPNQAGFIANQQGLLGPLGNVPLGNGPLGGVQIGNQRIDNLLNGDLFNGNQLNVNQLNGNQLNGNQFNGNQLNGIQFNGNQLNGNQLLRNIPVGNQILGNQPIGNLPLGNQLITNHFQSNQFIGTQFINDNELIGS